MQHWPEMGLTCDSKDRKKRNFEKLSTQAHDAVIQFRKHYHIFPFISKQQSFAFQCQREKSQKVHMATTS